MNSMALRTFFACLLYTSQQIELSQRVLGKRIPLRGRVLQKLNGRIYILRHTFRAGEQQLAEPVSRVWIVLLRCLPQPVKGLRELLLLQQQFAQRVCRARITGLRRFLKPLCRRFSDVYKRQAPAPVLWEGVLPCASL